MYFNIWAILHNILVLIIYCQMPLKITNADVSSGARGLNFGLSLHLHPDFVLIGGQTFLINFSNSNIQ